MNDNKIIPKIFYFIYDLEYINLDIEIQSYFSIKSIIEIGNPEVIYFYYIYLPNGKLWNMIKDKLILKKIDLKIGLNEEYKKENIIYFNLIKNGGIYIDKYTLLINSINDLLSYNFIKSNNNEIICSIKNSSIAKKYFDFYYKKKIFNQNINVDINENINENMNENINDLLFNNINNNTLLLNDLLYDNSYNNIYNIIFKEITDYSFGDYFHIIKNCYLININNNKNNLKNINLYNIFNKITIYNLLIRYILTYNTITYEISYNNLDNKNLLLINNIDKIYWINLEKSIYRKNKMIQILNNFDIKNIRIDAYDGSIIENINEKYFYNELNIFPDYSNKEYAILLSHLTAIETFSNSEDNKYGIALICEDDLSLDFINYWNKDIKTIIDNAPEDWDILMLGYFSVNLNRENLYEKWNNEWSAISYLVNYNKIQKIDKLKKNGKWICNENDLMVSDNYIFSKFNTYVYKYPYFTFPNNNNSTFHKDHLDYHKIYKISNYITLENIYNLYCD